VSATPQHAGNKAAAAAALLTVAVTVFYAYTINRQGDAGSRPWFVGGSLVTSSLVLLASTLVANVPARFLLLSMGTWTLLIWTVLGAFSIGALLLPAAVIALFATARATPLLSPVIVWSILITSAAASMLVLVVVLSSSS
jgi:hypothetical protein